MSMKETLLKVYKMIVEDYVGCTIDNHMTTSYNVINLLYSLQLTDLDLSHMTGKRKN